MKETVHRLNKEFPPLERLRGWLQLLFHFLHDPYFVFTLAIFQLHAVLKNGVPQRSILNVTLFAAIISGTVWLVHVYHLQGVL
jgi:hypothetical protein